MSEDNLIADMRKQFGNQAADDYLKLVSATRSLTYAWDGYVRAPVGSSLEAVLGAAMSQMMSGFQDRPEHAIAMIESLLALIQHMRMGGTYDAWFEDLGVSQKPGGDDT